MVIKCTFFFCCDRKMQSTKIKKKKCWYLWGRLFLKWSKEELHLNGVDHVTVCRYLWGRREGASRMERPWEAPERWGLDLSRKSCSQRRLVYCRAPAVSSSAHHRPCTPPALGEMPDGETEIESQVTWRRSPSALAATKPVWIWLSFKSVL